MSRLAMSLVLLLTVAGCKGELTGGSDGGGSNGNSQLSDAGGSESAEAFEHSAEDLTRVPLRRLSADEYERSIEFAFGIPVNRLWSFSPERQVDLFDNTADRMTISSAQFETWSVASRELADSLWKARRLREGRVHQLDLSPENFANLGSQCCHVSSEAEVELGRGKTAISWNVDVPIAGEYELTLTAHSADGSGRIITRLGGGYGTEFFLGDDLERVKTSVVSLNRGLNTIGINAPGTPAHVGEIRLRGPLNLSVEEDKLLKDCDEGESASDCALRVLEGPAEALLRQPLTEEHRGFIRRLSTLGADSSEGVTLALEGLLLHPEFVSRPESKGTAELEPAALATRMSYFLWGQGPDQALVDTVRDGSLVEESVREEQVLRMLKDPKAKALVDRFAAQWLQLSPLQWEGISGERLSKSEQASLREEGRLFLSRFIRDGESLRNLLSAASIDVLPENRRFYELEPGAEREIIDVQALDRQGLMGLAAVLAITGEAQDPVSAVRRGKYVLQRLLCEEPPPPPPGADDVVVPFPEDASEWERAALHRVEPGCASCHKEMDPIGFAMAFFDGTGLPRDVDSFGGQIPESTTLPSGEELSGINDLGTWISEDERLASCIAQHTLSFAIGTDTKDAQELSSLAEHLVESEWSFEALVLAIVESNAFLQRPQSE